MPLSGDFELCVFDPCQGQPIARIAMPLTGLGSGGMQFVPPTGNANVGVTVTHHPWTIGATSVLFHNAGSASSTVELAGFAHGPASAASTTAQPSGVVQLVTVSKAFTTLASAFPEVPITSTLTLRFVPEPSAPVLLVCAAAAVLALGWRSDRPGRR